MSRLVERLYIVGGVVALNLLVFHFARLVDLSVFFLISVFLSPIGGPILLFFPVPYLVAAPFAFRKLKREKEDQRWRIVAGCCVLLSVLLVVELNVSYSVLVAL